MLITAKIQKPIERISQCDIFKDVDVVEYVKETEGKVIVSTLHFPMVICLNQDCDLNSDFRDKQEEHSNKNCRLLHLIVAPIFNFDEFLKGEHWGDLFMVAPHMKRKDTAVKKIMNNDDPRFHFLHFDESQNLPDYVIDFKHFFTISTDYLYLNIDKRLFSLADLYREKITQRFAFFQSRIGLPD